MGGGSEKPSNLAEASRFRAFAAAAMLASLLAGVAAVVLAESTMVRLAAVALTAAALKVAAPVVAGSRGRPVVLAAILAGGIAALWAWLYAAHPVPPLQKLHTAVVFTYGAIAVAAALRAARLLDEARALLVSFSFAIPLLALEGLLGTAPVTNFTPWQVSGYDDPEVGFRYKAHSTGYNYYPSNPRNYFEESNPRLASWALESHEGSRAVLEHSATTPGAMTITISSLPQTVAWHVKLMQSPFRIARGAHYALNFQARADSERPIGVAIAQNQAPWATHAPYQQVRLKPEWESFALQFSATAGDTNARIFFDLGDSASRVELKDVSLFGSSRSRIEPRLGSVEYFVRYRFNALGFRGADYAVPRPPDTFRILALGDSYTQGVGVHERDTFTVQLEQILNATAAKQPGRLRYEVINAGITGYDTRAERITYERIASAYEPQVVLLMMVFNDDMSFQEETRRGLLPHTSTSGLASNLRSRIGSATQADRPYDYTAAITEARKLNDLCRERGAKLAVAVFRNTRWFAPWTKLLKDVREGLTDTGIPLLDLGEILLADGAVETALVVHAVDGHPNDTAHRLAAEGIETFLRTHQMLP